jgi:ketosteroid isomerase-like protein
MAQENVERLKAALDAYNREGPEAIVDLLDPDVEWIADRSDMGRVTYRGVEGVRKSFEELYEGFDKVGMEVDELIEADDKLLVLGQLTARGRSTELPVVVQGVSNVVPTHGCALASGTAGAWVGLWVGHEYFSSSRLILSNSGSSNFCRLALGRLSP